MSRMIYAAACIARLFICFCWNFCLWAKKSTQANKIVYNKYEKKEVRERLSGVGNADYEYGKNIGRIGRFGRRGRY